MILLLKFLPFSLFKVQGVSMFPTFHSGDTVVTYNWAYFWRKPKVGEIVVVFVQDRLMVKRVTKVNAHSIFLIGDNKKSSNDSRHFGEISVAHVIGKVIGK